MELTRTRNVAIGLIVSLLLAFAVMLAAPVEEAHAVAPRTGTYTLKYCTHNPIPSYAGPVDVVCTYKVKVISYNRAKKVVKLRLYVANCNSANDYTSKTITAKVKKGASTFTFRYGNRYWNSYPCKARAKIIWGKKSLKIKMRTLNYAGELRGFDTYNAAGKRAFIKIAKGTHRRYID